MFASNHSRVLVSCAALWLGGIALIAATHAVAAPFCKPVLAFKKVRFSEVQPEGMERRWTALLSVDASRCATASGRFEILFSRLKENGPEVEFVEPFAWRPNLVEVSVDFWADEAVGGHWLNKVAPCPCRE